MYCYVEAFSSCSLTPKYQPLTPWSMDVSAWKQAENRKKNKSITLIESLDLPNNSGSIHVMLNHPRFFLRPITNRWHDHHNPDTGGTVFNTTLSKAGGNIQPVWQRPGDAPGNAGFSSEGLSYGLISMRYSQIHCFKVSRLGGYVHYSWWAWAKHRKWRETRKHLTWLSHLALLSAA